MDIKILFDQLNGAAEEYFLAPPEFPVADDLIPGNANFEPECEFRGGVKRSFYNDTAKNFYFVTKDLHPPRRDFAWFKAREIILNKRKDYEVQYYTNEGILRSLAKNSEKLDDNLNFIIESDISKDSPSYIIRICKCRDWSWSDAFAFEGRGRNRNLKPCGSNWCYSFKVTWNPYIKMKKKIQLYRWMWYAFDCAVDQKAFPLSGELYFDSKLESEDFRKGPEKVFRSHFDPLCRKFFEEESLDTRFESMSLDSSTGEQDGEGYNVDWARESYLWCVFPKPCRAVKRSFEPHANDLSKKKRFE
eukprot:GHVP01025555.1.p1 GENE.GHVP01025555.1~~GHVP01025555.1.p1  ORF type:complete len:303 (+),score=44.83 GHVP01025555.1:520-1428(+)